MTTPTPGQPNYPQPMGQPGYPAGYPGYPTGQPGHPGYPTGQPGYAVGQPGYPAGYPAPAPYGQAPAAFAQAPAPFAPAPPRRTRRWVVLGVCVVVVLALTAGVGAWAAVRYWYNAGEQAEKMMPASVGAYARVDLDPSLDQTTKVLSLLHKFPKTSKSVGTRSPEVESKLLESFGVSGLKFDTDVKPWFGHKAGLGEWTDAAKHRYALVVLSTTDDDKARASIKQAIARSTRQGELGFVVDHGWVLLAKGDNGGQAAAEAAAAEARSHPLAADPRFSRLLGKLSGSQLLIGWVDIARLSAQGVFGTSSLPSTFGRLAQASGAGKSPLDNLNGYAMVGVQAGDQGLEIRIRIGGLKNAPATGADARPVLDAMPGNSIIAAAYAPDSETSRQLAKYAAGLDKTLDGATAGTPKSPGKPSPSTKASPPGNSSKLTEAIAALLGSRMFSLSITAMNGEIPALQFTADTGSDAAAAKVTTAAEPFADKDFTVASRGGNVDFTTKGYSPTGTLATQSLYRQALVGAPGKASVAFYIDLQGLFDSFHLSSADDRADAAPLKALAGAFGRDGDDSVGLVRLVIL